MIFIAQVILVFLIFVTFQQRSNSYEAGWLGGVIALLALRGLEWVMS